MQQQTLYRAQRELNGELNIDQKKIFMILWSRKFLIIKVFCIILFF